MGDRPGHKFRGNQWGSAAHGSGSAPARSAGDYKRLVVRSSDPREPERVNELTRPGHAYRGMSQAEYDATVGAGRGVKSNGAFSFASEGTSFARDAMTAEDYVNFGRDDPRTTGRPTYLVEVKHDEAKLKGIKGYDYLQAHSEIPRTDITRVWKMTGEGKNVVATLVFEGAK